ncbi:MAG: tRNA dihydrouridine synthase DusB [Actinobacteria bacterium]|nr:tRNA dihydrouridine synthase DusB [Actinomycetota bacterium]
MQKFQPGGFLDALNSLVREYSSELYSFCAITENRTDNIPGDHEREKKTFISDQYLTESLKDANIFSGFNIGKLKIAGPLVSAPLAGISDNTFRIFSHAFGAALNFTEMISSFGLHYNNRATEALSNITSGERPCAVQIFGCVPEILLEAAQRLQDKADIIDINMGCPVPKVLKAKSGGFLLTDEGLIKKIISDIASAINKPLTIKIRLGWDKNSINVHRIVKIAENYGASAVTIHGRTVKQGFGGDADYEFIKKIKQKSNIPIIVSGDIDGPLKALQVLKYTGCEALMIGRSARGRQWIFKNILAGLDYFKKIPFPEYVRAFDYEPSVRFKKRFALMYLSSMIEFEGEARAVKQFRKYLAWIFKGVSNISRIRKDFFTVNDYEDVAKLINDIKG